MMDNPMAFNNHSNPLFIAFITEKESTTNATNKTPCTIPKIFTASGQLYRYFNGMAIPSSIKKETPSEIAMKRKNFTMFMIVNNR